MLKLALKTIINEIDIWSSLDHQYILKFRGIGKKPKINHGKVSDGDKDGEGGGDGEDSRICHKG